MEKFLQLKSHLQRNHQPKSQTLLLKSVQKTNRCVTVEEGFPVGSIGNHISAWLMENAFDWLDAPVINCAGKDVPMPYAANLERLALITAGEVCPVVWQRWGINGRYELISKTVERDVAATTTYTMKEV